MRGYELRERDDGSVDLVEVVPTVIATFTSRVHAESYYNFLAESGTEPVAKARPALPAPERPKPEAVAPKPAQVDAAWSTPSVEEWDQAIKALDDGGDMKKIAAALNVNFYKLRGKYAAWRRRQNDQGATRAPEPAQEECRLCGREFKSSRDSDGLCARCSRG